MACLLSCGSASAILIAADDASDAAYSDGWGNGDNGGSGFGAWSLSSAFSGGFFRSSSTGLSGGSGANINVAGSSFGLYGQNFAEAIRSFASLAVGSTFSIDLAVNYRNGNKGIDLRDSSGTTIFNLNVGGDDYKVNNVVSGGGSIGNGYSANTSFTLSFTQTSLSGGTWEILRDGGVSDMDVGQYNGVAAGFKLYVNGTQGGSENDLFANSMSISAIPEPTAALFGGLLTATLGTTLLRRPQRDVAA